MCLHYHNKVNEIDDERKKNQEKKNKKQQMELNNMQQWNAYILERWTGTCGTLWLAIITEYV